MPTMNDSPDEQTQFDQQANLLAQFCATNDIRDYLCYPNRIGSFIYATNGWIGIRVPDNGLLDARDCDKLKNMPALFETAVAEFIDLPELPAPNTCKTCSGSGKEYKEGCDECDGEGSFEYGSHSYDCKNCDGSGKVKQVIQDGAGAPCEQCGGTGHDNYQIASVGSSTYLRNLLEKIAGLPGAKIQSHTNGCHPARFIFDGGEGVVLPCRA